MRVSREDATRVRLLRPLARVADGLAHNRARRRTIQRYRRVQCVLLVAEQSADSVGNA
jgi:hypothetical protein